METSAVQNPFYLYILLGVFAGIFSATFGVGSGVIMIPVLTLLAGYTQKEAQGMALAVMVPMALMGALRYHWNPDIQIDWDRVLILAIAVIVGANIGATIAGLATNKQLQIGFSLFLIFVGLRMLWSVWQS